MVRLPPPCLIAGGNAVISGHVLEIFQTPPLRAVRFFLRFRNRRLRCRFRVLFPLRSHCGKPLKIVRRRRSVFRGIERRAFLSVPGDGDVPVFVLRERFERAFLNRRARGVGYGSGRRLSGLRAHPRFRARTVFGSFVFPRRLTLIENRRSGPPVVFGREDLRRSRPVCVAE